MNKKPLNTRKKLGAIDVIIHVKIPTLLHDQIVESARKNDRTTSAEIRRMLSTQAQVQVGAK